MAHLNFQDLTKIVKNTNDVKISKKDDKLTWLTCLEGKKKRLPFKHNESKTTKLLVLVPSNICGQIETRSLGGANYFMTFIDDYSKKVFVYFLHKKSEALEKFKEFKNQVEKQLEFHIKYLRSDKGLEYVNSSFSEFLKSNGIIHQTTTPYTPEQNEVSERMNGTLVEEAKCLLINANLPKVYWAESIHTAAYLMNRSPTRSLKYKTLKEIWKGKKPNIHYLKVFGCEAMTHLLKEKTRKWIPSIPADPHVKLQKVNDKSKKDHPYREIVGSLIHAATVSRPDIMFAVSQTVNSTTVVPKVYPSRNKHSSPAPQLGHLTGGKKRIRSVRGTRRPRWVFAGFSSTSALHQLRDLRSRPDASSACARVAVALA
ncbi:Retrovirus-related Pol polyprotein from transposon TNT 1-94 [Eumeta japonica]|uniref:Retrovirus-related Pol polyprotein from transposon TNT 1-94 n=1 Tax=Eumeta variegata TaxID=151549 RepID=A0A4C1WMU7_EUMVA|nr:Retrovirus-related Pol polyprotein from transposon TNT 1-94 [Eumeta japonica]